MNRLTKKNMVFMLARSSCKTLFDKIYRKLSKLEDLEEQLGCPLEVREKAFDKGFYDENGNLLRFLLSGTYQIIKLPKEPKKKKLRDLTREEWDRWLKKNCGTCNCDKCVFDKASCEASYSDRSWVSNKEIYSEKFLNQEIEVE